MAKPNLVTLEIPLLNDKGIHKVEAEVIGDLALSIRQDKDFLTITHVPTLLHFRSAVPPEICGDWSDNKARRARLKKWMEKVQEKSPVSKDWLAMRKFTADNVRAHPDDTNKVRERVRNHCLSIKKV